MEICKYLILGGGPTGLSLANALHDAGEENFVVCEKEQSAGGLCRSVNVEGSPLDIGGGHFLDVRRPHINNFLFRFMPEDEWNIFERDSRIMVDGEVISHPFEANIWQMSQEMQIEYLKSIAIAGCNIGLPQPERFTEWIYWKLGDKISEKYMIPYNLKMFGAEMNNLGTYWLDKLPNVSFDDTLLSCLNQKPYGTQPGHAQFYYPKRYGYGEVWLRMAAAVNAHIKYDAIVDSIDFDKRIVKLSNGNKIKANYIITTIPWTSVKEYIGLPTELLKEINTLKYTSVNVTYVPEQMDTKAQWIYYPDLKLSYHRILVRSNFYVDAKGYWTETNSERYKDEGKLSFCNEYAYPLNTIKKPDIMKRLLAWSRKKGIFGLGRWGEWQHYNSDVAVERALNMAKELIQ